jgi:hypothetical protein
LNGGSRSAGLPAPPCSPEGLRYGFILKRSGGLRSGRGSPKGLRDVQGWALKLHPLSSTVLKG